MNARLSKLLIAGLAALVLSGQALASPRFMDRGFPEFSAGNDRMERDYGKRDTREPRKADSRQEKQDLRKPDERGQERGYGYGYERRNPQQRQDGRERR